MRALTVPLARPYPIYFRQGAGEELRARLIEATSTGALLIITDARVGALYGEALQADLRAAGLRVPLLSFPEGEAHKTLATVAGLYERAIEASVDRATPIVALGGGVVGDLAGFVAATLHRGHPLIQIPTTLLAQLDSSVGGKTGFNLPAGKNLVGAFHQPEWVFTDLAYLATLPLEERRAALSELLKCLLLDRPDLIEVFARSVEGLLAGDPAVTAPLLYAAVETKAKIVALDERDLGQRMVLNLGHTLAHGVELCAGMRHGEAVAIGLSFALHLSVERLGFPRDQHREILSILERCGLPVDWRAWSGDDVLGKIAKDKKIRAEYISFIALERPGAPRVAKLTLEELGAMVGNGG
ncbi:3-dehydroquinate synthase [Myxococcota bacterium]|nr:3-dehydroquinate synthase [Myxococcota bacterium]MBU1429343.1 3-dehydroquinate synthase [Myxococcota bacterium]MBU1899599.1 3-dehydroquinate synthase [Myxococcota bacterium]